MRGILDSWWAVGIFLVEHRIIPDAATRIGIRMRLARALESLAEEYKGKNATEVFLMELDQSPVAVEIKKVNEQHYEVPTAYFDIALGPRKKYSSCLWEKAKTLPEAEEEMLALSVERAEIKDGMSILDLGCGWGSLSLYIAEKFPNTRITAFSNSRTQKEYIDKVAAEKSFKNITVVTGNAGEILPQGPYDRVVSVEMLEHVRNHKVLFARLQKEVAPDGKFFVHVFSHHTYPFLYEDSGKATDWMAREFFSGGVMPSHDLLPHAAKKSFVLEKEWKVNGVHYAKTLRAWLDLHDKHEAQTRKIFKNADFKNPTVTSSRWRLFYIACEEFFGYKGGEEWGVSHYLFSKK